MRIVILLVSLLSVMGFASAQDAPDRPVWDDLDAGVWTQIAGGENTICSNGTDYSFFARPASEPTGKVLIHFQGGGACWQGENCLSTGRPTYDMSVNDSDNPTGAGGIADVDNPENPFRDYNMIYAPYCTGDVHLGSAENTYSVGETERVVHHNGFSNAQDVLAWMFENITDPTDVFVTGCSAGAMPSPFYTLWVAENYPDARIFQLGDAGGSYRNNDEKKLTEIFRIWGTFDILGEYFADIPDEELGFETLYTIAANRHPDIQFAQYNAAYDITQTGFIIMAGLGDPDTHAMLNENLADIRASLGQDNFHAFTAGGGTHCLTITNQMYTFAADGVRFVDWLAALERGDALEDVACTGDCRTVETITP